MSEICTIYSEYRPIKIMTDGEYYYVDDGYCYECFDDYESAEDWAMHM